jgi:hypothetical protein
MWISCLHPCLKPSIWQVLVVHKGVLTGETNFLYLFFHLKYRVFQHRWGSNLSPTTISYFIHSVHKFAKALITHD